MMDDPETKIEVETPYELLKDDQQKQLGKNNEAKMTLYNAILRKKYERVFMCKITKEVWHTLIITHQGNSQVKDYKIDLLTQQYEKFLISSEKTIDSGFTRFNATVTSLKSLDHNYSSKNHARKFGRGCGTSFGNKGGESSRQNRGCYNWGEEGHFISECPKPKENKAFIGGALSDSEDDNEPQNNATCLMEFESQEVLSKPSRSNNDLDIIDFQKENKERLRLQEEALNFSKFKKSSIVLDNILSHKKLSQDKEGLGFSKNDKTTFVCIKCDLLPDDWIMDNGCIKYMTRNKRLFTLYKAYDGGHKGQGHRRSFTKVDYTISKNGKTLDKGHRINGLYTCKLGDNSKQQICLASMVDNSMLWHRRLGHANIRESSLPKPKLSHSVEDDRVNGPLVQNPVRSPSLEANASEPGYPKSIKEARGHPIEQVIVIMEYLVKISKKARTLELKRRHLKITVLTSNMPYPSRKIRRICACTSPKTTKDQGSIRRIQRRPIRRIQEEGKIPTWEELVEKLFCKFYPESHDGEDEMLDEGDNWGIDRLEFISRVNSSFGNHMKVDGRTKKVLFHSWMNGSWNKRRVDNNILRNKEWKESDCGNPLNTATDSFFKVYDEHDIEEGSELRQMKRKEDNKNDEQPQEEKLLDEEERPKHPFTTLDLQQTLIQRFSALRLPPRFSANKTPWDYHSVKN
ncbi:zf-CCHC domain-containing protein [Tanacetum coccineum]